MKNEKLFLLLFFFPILIFSQEINTEKSTVNFTAGTMGVFKVKGEFTGFSGEVNFDPENLETAKIAVCVETKTVESGNKKRDDHIRSEDFLAVEEYPQVCFTSTEITKHADNYLVKGELKIKETTKTVEIPLRYKENQLIGNLNFNRLDYNVGEDIGKFKAKDKISVNIHCFLE